MIFKRVGTKTMKISDIKIPEGAVLNAEYVKEFQEAINEDGSIDLNKVSLEALFADYTLLFDKEDLAKYFCARALFEKGVAVIEEHEDYGLVWHTLFVGEKCFQKPISSLFRSESNKKAIREIDVEEKVASLLHDMGEKVQRQVRCLSGIADIVTDNLIVEVKLLLTISSIKKAVGQLLMYRPAINPKAKLVIAGIATKELESVRNYLRSIGIEVIEMRKEEFE